MKAVNNNTYEQVYNVREDETIISQVATVVCVLDQRSLFCAGFSAAKELLTIHYTCYNRNQPVWELDFFEHLFSTEPLLADKDKVKGVFVASEKNMIIPHELFDEYEAPVWLKRFYFVEPKDVIESYVLDSDKACYVQAAPLSIAQLVKINFKKTGILPLSFYQFRTAKTESLFMQLCITSDRVYITLHNYSQLLWHHNFEYSSAEDIAYHIHLYCRENNIEYGRLNMICDAISGGEYDTINDLTQYFTAIRNGNGEPINGRWDPAVSLAQQLLACVS